MNRKAGLMILSVALFSSLFLPLFEWNSFEMNGLNYVLSTHIPTYRYILLLVPFSAICIFFRAVSGENSFFNRKFISWLPFPALVFVLIMNFRSPNREPGFPVSDNIFLNVDTGFWLALIFSFLLVFTREKKKTQYRNELSFFE
jgi:hypothetical protein